MLANRNPDRDKVIRETSLLAIILNSIMAAVKIIIGLISGSVAIVSDGINNAGDILSSFVTMLGNIIAKRKPTHSHPLGFGRIEYLSALIVSFIILFAGFELLSSSVSKIIEPTEMDMSQMMVLIIIVTIFMKLFLWKLNSRAAVKTDSDALKASATDSLIDALSSSVTVLAVIISYAAPINLDGWAGLLVSIFILYSGVRNILTTVSSIVGERPAKASLLSNSEFYRVFASENWAPNLEFLKKIGHNVYIVKDPSVVSDPHVWSVVPHDKPTLLNRFDVGFIQMLKTEYWASFVCQCAGGTQLGDYPLESLSP